MPPNPANLLKTATRLLAKREHSRHELAEKLRARAGGEGGQAAEEAIAAALQKLAARGLQCDARFARQYVRQKWQEQGNERLWQELQRRGVADDEIAAAMAEECRQSEGERACALLRRKYPRGVAGKTAQALRFLQQRGFDEETCQQATEQAAAGG